MHPTIRLDHVSPGGMRLMQLRAYSSFYGRPAKAVENMSYIMRVVPNLSGHLSLKALATPANLVAYPLLCAWKWFVGVPRPTG